LARSASGCWPRSLIRPSFRFLEALAREAEEAEDQAG
jgi:hypothetical protein